MNTIASIILSFTIGLAAGKFFKKKTVAERLQKILATEINEKFSALETKLMQTVKVSKNHKGSTALLPRVTKDQLSDVVVTLAECFAPIYVDKLDLLMNDRMRGEYVSASVNGIGRKIDDVIIDALFQPSKAVMTITGPVTYEKLLDVEKFFDDAGVDRKDRFVVCGAKQIAEALRIKQLTTTGYDGLLQVNNSGVGHAMGLNWIMSARLFGHAQDTCVAYAQDTIGLAMDGEIAFHLDWVPPKASWLMNAATTFGAKIIK